jgi:hypothetical protein
MLQKNQSLWESTNVQNLFRYRPSGTYFARFKIGDKPIRQSLETTVFSVAKQRLPEKMREYRSRHESTKAFADGKMTVGDAAQVYLLKARASASLKPRSKDYREMILGFIKRSWPSLLETDVRKVSERDCENWFARYQHCRLLRFSETMAGMRRCHRARPARFATLARAHRDVRLCLRLNAGTRATPFLV